MACCSKLIGSWYSVPSNVNLAAANPTRPWHHRIAAPARGGQRRVVAQDQHRPHRHSTRQHGLPSKAPMAHWADPDWSSITGTFCTADSGDAWFGATSSGSVGDRGRSSWRHGRRRDRSGVVRAGGRHARRHRCHGAQAGRQDLGPAGDGRRERRDESVGRRTRRRGADRQPVHALRRHLRGSPTELDQRRRGPSTPSRWCRQCRSVARHRVRRSRPAASEPRCRCRWSTTARSPCYWRCSPTPLPDQALPGTIQEHEQHEQHNRQRTVESPSFEYHVRPDFNGIVRVITFCSLTDGAIEHLAVRR